MSSLPYYSGKCVRLSLSNLFRRGVQQLTGAGKYGLIQEMAFTQVLKKNVQRLLHHLRQGIRKPGVKIQIAQQQIVFAEELGLRERLAPVQPVLLLPGMFRIVHHPPLAVLLFQLPGLHQPLADLRNWRALPPVCPIRGSWIIILPWGRKSPSSRRTRPARRNQAAGADIHH